MMLQWILAGLTLTSGWMVIKVQASGDNFQGDDSTSGPVIDKLHIKSHIFSQYAITHVTSWMTNQGEDGKEMVFTVHLPKEAFISNFSMVIDGKAVRGHLEEAQLARDRYERTRNKGQQGHLWATQSFEMNIFKVTINTVAKSSAVFNLTYEEKLERKLGLYSHIIPLRPEQVVPELKVEISIREGQPISQFNVIPGGDVPQASDDSSPLMKTQTVTSAHVSYHPNEAQQSAISNKGLHGQLTIEYDIERGDNGGHIQVNGDYFVYHFTPPSMRPLDKDILFILDVSGSMAATKLSQVSEAMTLILSDLRRGDTFNIVTFSTWLKFWNVEAMVPATDSNIRKAKHFIRKVKAEGGTNFNDALIRGTDFILRKKPTGVSTRSSIIVFLTDGEPTSGITSTNQILANLREVNKGQACIFTLGFGKSVDFNFLQKIAVQNNGFAIHLNESADGALQIVNIFREIASPVLSNVKILQSREMLVANATKGAFHTLFLGTDLVYSGKLKSRSTLRTLSFGVTGDGVTGELNLETIKTTQLQSNHAQNAYFLERIWAFMTIKDLYGKILATSNKTEVNQLQQAIMDLSLKHSFVNTLISIVITQPDQPLTNAAYFLDQEEAATESKNKIRRPARGSHNGGRKKGWSPAHVKKKTSFVDNDPHFIVNVKGVEENICFDIDGEPSDTLQLLYDGPNGVVVNGFIVSTDMRTYFSQMAVMNDKVSILVSAYEIIINEKLYHWKHVSQVVEIEDVLINIHGRKNITVIMKPGITLAVRRQKVKNQNQTEKVDFLGFYITDGNGLSTEAHGIIGQFQHSTAAISHNLMAEPNGKLFGTLYVESNPTALKNSMRGSKFTDKTEELNASQKRSVSVRLSKRRNMELHEHVPCWYVRNNGQGAIFGHYKYYLVPKLLYSGFCLDYNNILIKKKEL